MIDELVLTNFRGFEKFRISFGHMGVLVGPNNAGKSSVIAALKATADLCRIASKQRAAEVRSDQGEQRFVYFFDSDQIGLETDNLRYQFADVETRVQLRLSSGVTLDVVWPKEPGSDEFFYVRGTGASSSWTPLGIRESLPAIGVIPVLTPIERKELVLTRPYVLRNLSTRLASRHFRNQLELLRSEPSVSHPNRLLEFHGFCAEWLPEVVLAIDAPVKRPTNEGLELDLLYREGRSSLEVAWAGDGIQIFLQLLLHIFRLQGMQTIVLDEPDVYLHADLQRRLLRLLSTLPSQVIFASHSTEMVLEAPPEALVWLDRSRKAAVRSPDAATLDALAETMGSQIRMRLARLMKARVALFVEGKDVVLLRNLAATVGASAFVTEAQIAAVPMEGFSNWRRLQPFPWLVGNFLRDTVHGYVILDRDVHDLAALKRITDELGGLGLECHVWERNELENYLLSPDAISRSSGAPRDWVIDQLDGITAGMKSYVLSRMISTRFDERADRSLKLAAIAKLCSEEVDANWGTLQQRVQICPGKEVIAILNQRLQAVKHSTVNAYGLSRSIQSAELPSELGEVLRHVHKLAAAPSGRHHH